MWLTHGSNSGPRADWWQITTYCERPSFWDTLDAHPHHLAHCSSLSHTVFLAVTSNHPYLYETTSKSHKDFIHFIKTRLNLWVHYLFGSFSSTRNNCTKIKRSLQNSLVHRYIHGDFFKMQSFQKNINRTFFFCLYLIYFLLFIYAMP